MLRLVLCFSLPLLVHTHAYAQDERSPSSLRVLVERLNRSLAVRRVTLSNGLRVVLNRVPDSGVASVVMNYGVGSSSEGEGETGYAHLLEHWLLEGSEHTGLFGGVRLAAERGGWANATTTRDRTNFYENMPRSELPLALWIEADRMRAPTLDVARLSVQQEVVLDERRQSDDSVPLIAAYHSARARLFASYGPYRHGIGGREADTLAATRQSVARFHARAYVPNNAVLVVSGDFDEEDTLRRIRELFESVPAGAAVPVVEDPEGLLAMPEDLRLEIHDARVHQTWLRLNWTVPGTTHADHLVLQFIADLLVAQFKRDLQQAHLCQGIAAWMDGHRRADVFELGCSLIDGVDATEVRRIMLRDVETLRTALVDPSTLARTQRAIIGRWANSALYAKDRAIELADRELHDGDANAFAQDFIRIAEMTPEQVQAVAQRYLEREPLFVTLGSEAPHE